MMAPLLFATLALLARPARASYCGSCGQGCMGCENVDFGSCGNACCKLDLEIFDMTTETVMKSLNKTLHSGGQDGNWSASVLAEGVTGFADLRSITKDIDFIGQFVHTTYVGYRDSVSLTVARTGQSTKVRLFSYSLIGGAYGDSGQGYLNLKMIIDSLDLDDYQLTHVDRSCPNPITFAAGARESNES